MPWSLTGCPECGDQWAELWCAVCKCCEECCGGCESDDDFDADELGLDPEEPYDA